ncbi:MATE family efflux transporter [Candidatus Woesearchaeota archaeon]|nr:MATE family efflux transporter [Candidatus Woesearchaeota archaeon]
MARDLTTGSIRKHIIFLAAPMLAAMFMHNLFTLVDTFFVGKLGPDAIAAVSASFPLFFIIISLMAGLGIGITSLTARSIGAKEHAKVNVIAENGLIVAATIALAAFAIGLAAIRPLIGLMGVTAEVNKLMSDYLGIIYLGSSAFFIGNVANAILQGEGDTKTPMKALIIANLANIILDPLLIFGPGILPAMGVKGAAMATVFSQAAGAVYAYAHLFSGKALVKLAFKKFIFSWQIAKGILTVSLPTTASYLAISIGLFFINKLVAKFGSQTLAGFGIAMRVEAIAILPALAIGMATLTIIGQNIGAKKFGRAKQTSLLSTLAVFGFMEAVGLLLLLSATSWLPVFTNDEKVMQASTGYFGMVAVTYGFIGLRIIAANSFQGLGKAFAVLGVTGLNFGLMIPAAYILGFTLNMGIKGVWTGVIAANIIAGIIAQLWFQNTLKHAEKLHLEKSELVIAQ